MFICNLVDPFYPFKGAVDPFYPFKGAVDHSFPQDQTPTNLHSSHIVVGDLPYTRGGRGHVPPLHSFTREQVGLPDEPK